MLALLIICAVFGLVAALVLVFVAFTYRGRSLPVGERLSGGVAAVADKIDPGEAPPQGVLTKPEAARRTRRRIEAAEERVTSRLHAFAETVSGGSRHRPTHATAGERRHSRRP